MDTTRKIPLVGKVALGKRLRWWRSLPVRSRHTLPVRILLWTAE